ncbi:MAG: FG-GAP-like repeat-containing protein, partial [Fulvivirga sp.]|uniref:FG-GAP-like repeat-containing protein n=1 Tax=Fulvivirga sp. TaxID=1931237 RepID=UPI0032ED6FA1
MKNSIRLTFLLVLFSINLYSQNSFEGRRLIGVGNNPINITCSDLDNDGFPDIISANFDDDYISLIYNDSKGGVRNKVDLQTSPNPYRVITSQLNNDSFEDIIILNNSLEHVSILLNNTDGTFSEATILTTGNLPLDIKSSDIDNNTFPDIVVLNNDESANIFYNDGLGNFNPETLNLGFNSEQFTVGHLNLDSYADLVFTNPANDEISIFYGSSTGTFSNSSYSVGDNPHHIEISDLDNNTFNDIVVSNSFSDNITILLNGDGFDNYTSNTFSVNNNPRSARISLINDDNIPDLIVNTQLSVFSIFYGNGDGSFTFENSVGSSDDVGSFELVDFDSNGKLDIISSVFNLNKIEVLNGNNANGFGPIKIDIPSFALHRIAHYDYNNDGNIDLAIANQFGSASNHIITLMEGDGEGHFAFDKNLSIGLLTGITTIKFDFLNNDSNIDIAATSNYSGDVSILYGDGLGNFGDLNIVPVGANPTNMIIENLNDDAYPDIITSDRNSQNFTILFGDELNEYSSNSIISTTSPTDLALIDLNNDTQLDIINSSNSTSNLDYFIGLGNGNFLPQAKINTENEEYDWIETIDLNNDNLDDLIAADYNDDNFSIFLNNGNQQFEKRQSLSIDPSSRPRIADLNGDGHLDIAVLSNYSDLIILYGNGKGEFNISEKHFVGTDQWAQDLTVEDFNNDSRNDVVVLIRNKHRLFVYLQTEKSDLVPPTPALSINDDVLANQGIIELSLTFNEPLVDNISESDFILENCTITEISTSNNQDYVVLMSAINDGIASLSLPEGMVRDLAGNTNVQSNEITYIYDQEKPQLTFSNYSSVTNNSIVELTLVANEQLYNFNEDDFILTNCTITNFLNLDEFTYTLSAIPITEGTFSIVIPTNSF